MDIVCATLGVALTSLPMAVIALVVRATMGSPVLFRQERPGRSERPFTMYKFRTMTLAPGDSPLTADFARITRPGRFLRRTSLDELPELFNVIRGDMSLVGPRPLLTQYLERYTTEQARRHNVRPGITGWAQVNGRNAITWEEKFKLDVWYVDNWSLGLDLKILGMTLVQVLKREDVSAAGHATMPEFLGNHVEGDA